MAVSVDVVRVGDRWLVDGWYPVAWFTPPEGRQWVTGVADFAAGGFTNNGTIHLYGTPHDDFIDLVTRGQDQRSRNQRRAPDVFYQLALITPGILPSRARSRKQIRQRPNLRR